MTACLLAADSETGRLERRCKRKRPLAKHHLKA